MQALLERRKIEFLPVLNQVSAFEQMRKNQLEKIQNMPESVKLKELFKGNSNTERKAPINAVPYGYCYVEIPNNFKRENSKRKFYGPHPSDVEGDFWASFILLSKNKDYIDVKVLNRGEKGVKTLRKKGGELIEEYLPVKQAKFLRETEMKNAAEVLGISKNINFLKLPSGEDFPDGELLKHLLVLTDIIEEDIRLSDPDEIYGPSPYPDHPDHVAVNIAIVSALIRLGENNFYKNRRKPFYAFSDPEFGVAIGQEWAVKQIPSIYSGKNEVSAEIDTSFTYLLPRYRLDSNNGLLYPTQINNGDEINLRRNNHARKDELSAIYNHEFTVPPFIIVVPQEIEEQSLLALSKHHSQMNGKRYSELIPVLAALRADQVGRKGKYGFAFFPIIIPDVTSDSTLDTDLSGAEVFQLAKIL